MTPFDARLMQMQGPAAQGGDTSAGGMSPMFNTEGDTKWMAPSTTDLQNNLNYGINMGAAQQASQLASLQTQGYSTINPSFLGAYDRLNNPQAYGSSILNAPAGMFPSSAGAMGPFVTGSPAGPQGLSPSVRAAAQLPGSIPPPVSNAADAAAQAAYIAKLHPITAQSTPYEISQAQIARDPTGAAKEFLMATQKNPVSPSQEINQRLTTGGGAYNANLQPWLPRTGFGGQASDIGNQDLLDQELVSHPIMARLMQTDPEKAASMYQALTLGRSLQGDLAAHRTIVANQQKKFSDYTGSQAEKGMTINPSTGKITVVNDVMVPDTSPTAAPGSMRMTQQMAPATDEQEYMIKKGYAPYFGRDFPTPPDFGPELAKKQPLSEATLGPNQRPLFDQKIAAATAAKGKPLNLDERQAIQNDVRGRVSESGGFMGTMAHVGEFDQAELDRLSGKYGTPMQAPTVQNPYIQRAIDMGTANVGNVTNMPAYSPSAGAPFPNTTGLEDPRVQNFLNNVPRTSPYLQAATPFSMPKVGGAFSMSPLQRLQTWFPQQQGPPASSAALQAAQAANPARTYR